MSSLPASKRRSRPPRFFVAEAGECPRCSIASPSSARILKRWSCRSFGLQLVDLGSTRRHLGRRAGGFSLAWRTERAAQAGCAFSAAATARSMFPLVPRAARGRGTARWPPARLNFPFRRPLPLPRAAFAADQHRHLAEGLVRFESDLRGSCYLSAMSQELSRASYKSHHVDGGPVVSGSCRHRYLSKWRLQSNDSRRRTISMPRRSRLREMTQAGDRPFAVKPSTRAIAAVDDRMVGHLADRFFSTAARARAPHALDPLRHCDGAVVRTTMRSGIRPGHPSTERSRPCGQSPSPEDEHGVHLLPTPARRANRHARTRTDAPRRRSRSSAASKRQTWPGNRDVDHVYVTGSSRIVSTRVAATPAIADVRLAAGGLLLLDVTDRLACRRRWSRFRLRPSGQLPLRRSDGPAKQPRDGVG